MDADPNARQEALRYKQPIASREHILKLLDRWRVPTTYERLADYLALHDKRQRHALHLRLRAMVRDGQILKNRKQGYRVLDKARLEAGAVVAHRDGFGFVQRDNGGDDFYLSNEQMRGVLHGDRVLVREKGRNRGQRSKIEAAIVEVIERANTHIVGRFVSERGIAFVVAENRRIQHNVLLAPGDEGGASIGQIVIARIVKQPTKHTPPIGKVTRVLGDINIPGIETESAIYSHGISACFTEQIESEAARFGPQIANEDMRGRLDLRGLPLITIDGEDAQDFDDAVYCEKTGSGWRLLVAIADVAHYVKADEPIDQEAQRRGTSVYFPARVVPMLPEVLSNGLCSLKPEEARLCLVCEMSINAEGRLSRSRFSEAVMRSHARFTYNEVGKALDGEPCEARTQSLLPQLKNLHGLYKTLKQWRDQRGALVVDSTETRIVFDARQKIQRIEPLQRNDAHRLIEECMIVANVAAARFLRRHRMRALFRVHSAPAEDRIKELRAFIALRGMRFTGDGTLKTIDLAHLAERAASRADSHIIQTAILRSMKQAVYQPQCNGHFGLALDEYAHFTSPIRRYPDLLVHRAIKHVLGGGKSSDYAYSADHMRTFGQQCSQAERRAEEATRDVLSWLKCEYMQAHVGSRFSGVVSAVVPFGLFVQLEDIFIEGLVHITSLPKDYYHYESVSQQLVGERSRRRFGLGDSLDVEVLQVVLNERKIDLGIIEIGQHAKDQHPGKRRR